MNSHIILDSHSSLVASILQKIENLDARPSPGNTTNAQIFRFPSHITQRRAADIRPRVVSIGPFFHGHANFDGMESKKLEFVKRIKDDADQLSNLICKVKSFVEQARHCYSETSALDDYTFAQMLLVDSCFIIGFLTSLSREMEERLVSLDWSIKEIASDLLLLENQVPLFVVRVVYDTLRTSWEAFKNLPMNFTLILEPFLCMNIPWGFVEVPLHEANHLLHCYWLCFLPKPNEISLSPPSDTNQPDPIETAIPMNTLSTQYSRANWAENWNDFGATSDRNLPSVTHLSQEVGVIFKNRLRKEGEGFVTRFHNGIMEMSCLKIDESRKIILTNLVGFEKSLKLSERKVSSYMALLDSLINTEEDVALLQKYGIIFNGLNNNSKAAEFFNDIGNMCTINYQNHFFKNLFKDVNKYYKSVWNRRIASLHHNYFHNFWAVISVVAAGFLLLLTVVQTILGGFQTYYTIHHRN